MKTLIILHGWQSSKEKWEKVKNEIEKEGIEVLTLDLPGFKTEMILDRPWDLDDYLNWVKNFSLEKEKFFLLGHSFGGRIAIKFAVKYPEKVLGLILCSAAGIKPKKTIWGFLILSIAKIGNRLSFMPFHSFLRSFFYRFIVRKTDYLKAKGILNETFKKIIAEDLTPYLSQIPSQTLIIWGEKDRITPLSDAYLMKREIPNSALEIIPRVGHRVNLEAPEKLAEIIINFLRK